MAFALPHVGKGPHESITFVADRVVEPHDHCVSQSESKSDTTSIFGSRQIELRGRGSHFPSLGKKGSVPASEEVPPVLNRGQQRALVIEPVTFKPPQEFVPAESRLQIKWDGLSFVFLRGSH